MTILEDLIKKCRQSSLDNRGGSGGIVSTSAVIRKSGKPLSEDPRLNVKSLVLYTGNKTFSLKILNIGDDVAVTYRSSDSKIASVNNKGTITRKAGGQCVITASYLDEEEVEHSFDCQVTCSTAVARVGGIDYDSIDTAVDIARKRAMAVEPLSNNISYVFKSPDERIQVRDIFSGAKLYPKPCANTSVHVYAIENHRVERDVVEYYIVDLGDPEIEFTNAKTGVVSYMNLTSALQTAGTYRFLKDIPNMKRTIYCDLGALGGDITIDLNGHHLVATEDTVPAHSSLSIGILDVSRANVTVNGNGGSLKTNSTSLKRYGVHTKFANYTTILNDVDVFAYVHAAYAEDGKIIVNGGRYEVYCEDEVSFEVHAYTLNCLDAKYKAGSANVTVNGGDFYKFNPADNAAEDEHTNFMAEGHSVSYNEETETYTVS